NNALSTATDGHVAGVESAFSPFALGVGGMAFSDAASYSFISPAPNKALRFRSPAAPLLTTSSSSSSSSSSSAIDSATGGAAGCTLLQSLSRDSYTGLAVPGREHMRR